MNKSGLPPLNSLKSSKIDNEEEYYNELHDDGLFQDVNDEEDIASSSFFVEGEVMKIKKDLDKGLVAYKVRVEEDFLLIRDDDINLQVNEGDIIQAKVDEDDFIITDGGVKAYDAYYVDIISNSKNEDDVITVSDSSLQSKQGKGDGTFSFIDSIKAAIAAVKDESQQSKDFYDDDFEDDYYADNLEDEEMNKPSRTKGKTNSKSKIGNPFKWLINLYKKISTIIFNVIMKSIKWLSNVPIIGIIFNFLEKLSTGIKFIAYLWLPILIFILLGMGKLVLPSTDAPKDLVENVSSNEKNKANKKNKVNDKKNVKEDKSSKGNKKPKKSDIEKIDVDYKDVTTGDKPTIELSNEGNVYADIYANITFESEGLFSKKNKCSTESVLIAPNETKKVKLKCDRTLKTSKIKKFDIISEYKK